MPTEAFWGPFLNNHGNDSEEEKAFLGYLSTHTISAEAPLEELCAAYEAFQVWMRDSYTQDASATDHSLDEPVPLPPDVIGPYRLPQSAHADPALQKPREAATRPLDQRPDQPTPEEAAQAATARPAPAEAQVTPSYGSRRRGESSEGA